MQRYFKLLLTCLIGVISLTLQFVFHRAGTAQLFVTILALCFSTLLAIEMIRTLREGKYGVDILAITAIVATLAIGEYWASLMILLMLTGGEALEEYAAQQARTELKSLLDNSPQIAHRIINDQIMDIGVDEVQVGDLLLVRPGELVPVDGLVEQGVSSFDESSLTGESRPITKQIGDSLMSGSLNGDVAVQLRVEKLAIDSQYQQIVNLVKQAEQSPAAFVRLADTYAIPFTISAYVIAGLAWYFSGEPQRFAEVLVVASPCPLILAAPIAFISGISRSSKNGIIIKTGTTLEKLATAKSIAFDKTGTLTSGRLEVDQIIPQDSFNPQDLLLLAASAEQHSGHILARSLTAFTNNLNLQLLPAQHVQEITGDGVQATIADKIIRVGKFRFVSPQQSIPTPLKQTAIHISIDDHYAGYITFTDKIRTEAPQTIQDFHTLGISNIMLLTGDNQEIATEIGHSVGITTIHANCLPQDKITQIQQTPLALRPLIMVGDGVNDAPALTSADVGIAMGAHGSTSASESADVVILVDDLNKVSTAVDIAKHTMYIARQSVLIGIAICIVLMLIASTGIIPALFGALLQEVVDVVSILSALRARKGRTKVKASL